MTDKSKVLQRSIDEINAKLLAKGVKQGAKKVGSFVADSAHKGAATAQNAIIAGVAAPAGVKLSDKIYNQPKKKKEKKEFSSSDMAAYATAMKKNENFINEENILAKVEANLLDWAKTDIDAYLTAKKTIEQAKANYKKAEDENAIKHPLLQAVRSGAKFYGAMFTAMIIGLAIVAFYSGKVPHPGRFLKVVVDTVRPNLVADALALMGISAGYNVVKKLIHDKQEKNEMLSDRLQAHLILLEEQTKKESGAKKVVKGVGVGAGVGTAAGVAGGAKLGGHITKQLAQATGKRAASKMVGRAAGAALSTGLGAVGLVRGAAIGGVAAGAKHLIDKHKAKKAAKQGLKEAVEKLKNQKVYKNMSKKTNQAKEILNGSPAVKKALKKAAIKGGLKGAAITAGLGAAAYGIHKYKEEH